MQKTIKGNVEAEIVEKKSRFIANILYVQTKDEAEEALKTIRKKYYDAKHHCFAYNILTSDGLISKSSDDGEPSGTAGAPILNIINKNELVNIIVIVTRYFGGVLLGTGGLARAYSDSTIKALDKATYVVEKMGYEIEVEINYNDFDKFKFYCNKNGISIIETIYDEKIVCKIEIDDDEKEKILNVKEELSFKIEKFKVVKEKNIQKNLDI